MSGYKRISINAKEDATNRAHELLEPDEDIVIGEVGFAYIYLSNENEMPVEVYFDDFKVEHVKSPVVGSQDYYPFGLSFGNYQRENSLSNQYQYNGKEMQDELNLGWLDFGARMYTPEIGRFFKQDRFSEQYLNVSPYQYAANNPLLFVDINGDSISTAFFDKNGNRMSTIPDIVQKMFNKEYGISVGYNSKTGMMHYTGEVDGNISIQRSQITQKQYDTAMTRLGALDINGLNEAERKKRKMRRSDSIVIFFVLLLTAGSCNDWECTDGEYQIMDVPFESTNTHEIKLSLVFPFEWDQLYVLSGPRFPDEVEELIGLNYNETIPDDTREYIFVNDGLIVRDERSGCKCLEYLSTTDSEVIKYAYNSSLVVSCRNVEGEKICRIKTQ